jgi:hypothetical protein
VVGERERPGSPAAPDPCGALERFFLFLDVPKYKQAELRFHALLTGDLAKVELTLVCGGGRDISFGRDAYEPEPYVSRSELFNEIYDIWPMRRLLIVVILC